MRPNATKTQRPLTQPRTFNAGVLVGSDPRSAKPKVAGPRRGGRRRNPVSALARDSGVCPNTHARVTHSDDHAQVAKRKIQRLGTYPSSRTQPLPQGIGQGIVVAGGEEVHVDGLDL